VLEPALEKDLALEASALAPDALAAAMVT